nr:MAG TPA: hypothetical protein [Bacteriophage sp.]
MYGWLYRRALALKDVGENVRCRTLVIIGLCIKEWVLSHMMSKHTRP